MSRNEARKNIAVRLQGLLEIAELKMFSDRQASLLRRFGWMH
jgi:hypothetical protein